MPLNVEARAEEKERMLRAMPLALLVSRTCRALVAGGRMAAARPRAVLRPLCSAAGDGPAATWASLGLTEDLVAACENLDLPSPTPIQRLAIPAVTGGEDVLFAAETGSGKTLAYLLPVFSKLKAEEFAAGDDAKNLRRERRPRALVLVPTRELAAQVTAVAKSIAHVAKLGVRGCYGGSDGVGKQRKQLAGSFDVLVATPGRFRALWGGQGVHVSRTNVVVIDEVDTMLEQGFGQDLAEMFRGYDTNRDGKLVLSEIGLVIQRMVPDIVTDAQLGFVLADMDRDGSGCVSLLELGAWCDDLGASERTMSRVVVDTHAVSTAMGMALLAVLRRSVVI